MSELDDLQDADPLGLTAKNVDDIIAYHRKHIQNIASGVKVKKPKGEMISLDSIGITQELVKPKIVGFKRRF